MNSGQLKQLIKSMIKRQPDRFIHLTSAMESEQWAKSQPDDKADALAAWLCQCLGDDAIGSDDEIIQRIADLSSNSALADKPHNVSAFFQAPQNIRVPSEMELRKLAGDVLGRLH